LKNQTQSREQQRHTFIHENGWANAQISALTQDASFRRYYRLDNFVSSAMLMDAPPDKEAVLPFISIANHLDKIGIRAPRILASNIEQGFVLLEDMGDNTFTRLLAQGVDESTLYSRAIDTLASIHQNSRAVEPTLSDYQIPAYDFQHTCDEVLLFTQWYLAAINQEPANPDSEKEFIDLWQRAFSALPDIGTTLVLRDYHVDNLMMHDNECVVLDFQDALSGSPAYDVVSLLEDARRNISDEIVRQSYQRYVESQPVLNPSDFAHHYAFWGAQRHCKVAGIFTRLWLRDDKPHYLTHLPRVLRLMFQSLEHPNLVQLKQWFERQGIQKVHPGFEA
jgi:aminoglycoside/choline kinase family phosphotransferase